MKRTNYFYMSLLKMMLEEQTIMAIVTASLLVISELLPVFNIPANGIVHGLVSQCLSVVKGSESNVVNTVNEIN